MDLGEIERLMKLMQSYGFHEVEVEEAGRRVKLIQTSGLGMPNSGFMPHQYSYHPGAIAPMSHRATPQSESTQEKPATKEKSKFKEIRSPFVGTFYGGPAPGADDFVTVGKRVKKGDTLCIVEAMKMMNEIEADRDMVIVEILVENESPIEFDQLLFLVE